jgi:hypothetical protein
MVLTNPPIATRQSLAGASRSPGQTASVGLASSCWASGCRGHEQVWRESSRSPQRHCQDPFERGAVLPRNSSAIERGNLRGLGHRGCPAVRYAGDSGRTLSHWFATAETPARATLPADAHADVWWSAAGWRGLSTAFHLTVRVYRSSWWTRGPSTVVQFCVGARVRTSRRRWPSGECSQVAERRGHESNRTTGALFLGLLRDGPVKEVCQMGKDLVPAPTEYGEEPAGLAARWCSRIGPRGRWSGPGPS